MGVSPSRPDNLIDTMMPQVVEEEDESDNDDSLTPTTKRKKKSSRKLLQVRNTGGAYSKRPSR